MIWMWEAQAAPDQADNLRDWAVEALAGRAGVVYRSVGQAGELVVVLLPGVPPGTGPGDAGPAVDATLGADRCPLPDPPAELVAGAAHAWLFEQVHPTGPAGTDRPASRATP